MEKIKELIQNKKVMAAILIVFVCALFIAVFVFSRLGKSRQPEHGAVEASNTDSVKTVSTENTKPAEKDTTKTADMELETDAQGIVSSVITENGETIDLTSNEIETETKADGSVSYKLADGSEVVVNQDGTAKVNKKEETSRPAQPVTDVKKTTAAADNSSQAGEPSSSDKREENTAGTAPSVPQNTQPSNNTPQKPAEPVTAPPSPQPVPEPPVSQPTECQHMSTVRKVTAAATESADGAWAVVCSTCGSTLETGSIHSYGAHSVDIGGGQTATVYGYFDDEIADEVFRQLNTYRQENGLPALENRFHEESKIRAVECAYLFSHDRPNGQEFWEIHELIGVENIDYMIGGIMLSTDTPVSLISTAIMNDWKNSQGHNANMLTECELGGVGVFVTVIVDSDGIANREAVYAVQNFGTEY